MCVWHTHTHTMLQMSTKKTPYLFPSLLYISVPVTPRTGSSSAPTLRESIWFCQSKWLPGNSSAAAAAPCFPLEHRMFASLYILSLSLLSLSHHIPRTRKTSSLSQRVGFLIRLYILSLCLLIRATILTESPISLIHSRTCLISQAKLYNASPLTVLHSMAARALSRNPFGVLLALFFMF